MAHTLDPTSQLWAKQIKREHGFLQKTIQDVASKVSKHDDRIKAVESAVKAGAGTSSGDAHAVAALAKQVQVIDENGSAVVKQRIDDMEKAVNERLEDAEAGSEAVVKVVEGLQRDKQVAEEERKATLTKDKALLKRISEIEEGLKKYERNIELIGKRVNSTQIDQIKQSLDELTGQVEREGEQMARLEESVERLETTNAALMKANERLERKLKEGEEKAARAAEAKAKEEARALAKSKSKPKISSTPIKEPASPEDSASGRKKSHKWAGGGADKDIIAQGADLFGIKRAPKPPAPKPKPATTSASRPPPPKPAKKTPVPKKNPVPKTASEGSSRKSHKWAGGGADRDIIAAGLTQHSKYGYDNPWTDEYDTPTAKSPVANPQAATSQSAKTQSTEKRFEGGKAVVRSGRGWFEVERSPSPETDPDAEPEPLEPRRISAIKKLQEPKKPARVKKPIEYDADGNPIKRPRGRPRKYPRPEDSPSQSASESAGSSLVPLPIHPDVKKRTADTAFELEVSDASNPPTKKVKMFDEDESDTEAGAQQLSSATSRRVIYATHQPEEASRPAAPVAQMVAPKTNRREIVQLDDRETWDWDAEYQKFI